MTKKALITDVIGQDGAYLSEFLLDNGYEVHGIKELGWKATIELKEGLKSTNQWFLEI